MTDTTSAVPEGSRDTLSVYPPSVTWLVGLSGAAVGGAFLNFDKVSASPWWVRLVFFLAVAAFSVAVYYGVHYIFYLNEVANQTERATLIAKALQGASDEQKQKLDAQAAQANEAIDEAWENVGDAHDYSIPAFGVGMALSVLLLGFAMLAGPLPKPGEAGTQNFISVPRDAASSATPAFEITQSAVHATGHGREAHTFLLNQQSGDVWQMICRKPDEVEFRRVHRIGFNGQAEDPLP